MLTDFDTEILDEKESPEQLSPAAEAQRLPPRAQMAGNRALARAVEEALTEQAATAAEPAPEAPKPRQEQAPETPFAPQDESEARLALAAQAQTKAELGHEEAIKAEAESRADAEVASAIKLRQMRRNKALNRALAGLLRNPEAVPLAGLMDAYRDATEAETEQAANALTACYLRAETETRRRLRPALAEAIRQAADTELAKALSARLGAIAMPSSAVPAPPPEPDP